MRDCGDACCSAKYFCAAATFLSDSKKERAGLSAEVADDGAIGISGTPKNFFTPGALSTVDEVTR